MINYIIYFLTMYGLTNLLVFGSVHLIFWLNSEKNVGRYYQL